MIYYQPKPSVGLPATLPRQPETKGQNMAKEADRHVVKRENVWFPLAEHQRMLEAMAALKETNKSTFIRTSIANFIKMLKEKGVIK